MAEQGAQLDQDNFSAAVYGGLNTTSSRLAMPEEDSPDLLNVNINYDGSVSKRPGFDIYEGTTANDTLSSPRPHGSNSTSHYYVYETKNTPYSVVFHRYQDSPGLGANMEMSLLRDRQFSNTRGWDNFIWAAQAQSKPDVVPIQEPGQTRLLYLIGNSVPIQFRIRERSLSFVSNSAQIGLIAGAPTNAEINRWGGVTIFNSFIINKSTNQVYRANYNTTPKTIVGFDSIPDGEYWLVSVTWQYWCRAEYVRGDWCQDTVNRFNVDPVRDRTVPVTPSLLRGIEQSPRITVGSPYPLVVHNDATYTNLSNYTVTGGGNTDYQHSSGYATVVGQNNQPSPDFISFGAAAAGQVRFTRGFPTTFNSGNGINCNLCSLYIANDPDEYQIIPRNTAGVGTAGTAWNMRSRSFSVNLPGSTDMFWWTLDGMNNNGMAQAEWDMCFSYVFVNPAFVGAGAVAGIGSPNLIDISKDGFAWAAPGLWEVADYELGSFPSTGCVFQGRLYLGGFSGNPGTVAVSELNDSSVVGSFYKSFQLFTNIGEPEEAFDINLGLSRADDSVECLRDWQNSLWIFTRFCTYRVTGGNAGITGTTFSLQTVSGVGVVNSQCAVLTEQALMFLSPQGLYRLIPAGGLSDSYAVEEVSTKIRTVFDERRDLKGLAYLVWDSVRQNLYMALPRYSIQSTVDWFVYFAQRNAWSRWSDCSGEGLFTKHAFVSYNTPSESDLYIGHLVTTPTFLGDTNYEGYRLSRYPNQYFVDVVISASNSANWNRPSQRVVYYTFENDVYEYSTTAQFSGQVRGFRMLPFTDLKDVAVYQNGVELVFGVDYYKTPNSTIVFNFESTGLPLVIEQRTLEGLPTSVVVGYKQIVSANTRTSPTSPQPLVQSMVSYGDINPAVTPNYVVAIPYPCYHTTTTMSRGTIGNYKRLKHYFGYYRFDLGKRLERQDILSGESLEFIGTTINKAGVGVLILFNDEFDGSAASADIFGQDGLFFDSGNLGQQSPSRSVNSHARAWVPITGNAYSFNAVNYSFDHRTWKLVGFEIDLIMKKAKGFSRHD
jgi:hypothetical protein